MVVIFVTRALRQSEAVGSTIDTGQLDDVAGGGIIIYSLDGQQRVAFVAGTNSPSWPVEKRTANVVVFGR